MPIEETANFLAVLIFWPYGSTESAAEIGVHALISGRPIRPTSGTACQTEFLECRQRSEYFPSLTVIDEMGIPASAGPSLAAEGVVREAMVLRSLQGDCHE
jgi:hypothetical protein